MVRDVSHLSYHTFSNVAIKYIPTSFKLSSPTLESTIKGTVCGGYSNVKCLTCNRLDPECLGHWCRLECPGIKLYIKSYDYILVKLTDYICFTHRGLICDPSYITSKKVLPSLKRYTHCSICGTSIVRFTCKKDDDCIRLALTDENKEMYIDPIAFYETICQIPYDVQVIITGQSIKLQDMFYVDTIPIVPTYLRLSSKFDKVNEYAHYLTNKYIEIIGLMREYYKPDSETSSKRIIITRIQIKMNEIIDGKESVDPKYESCSGSLKTKYNLFREHINGTRSPNTARVVLNANTIPKLNYFFPCIQYIESIRTSIIYCDYTKHLIENLINNKEIVSYFSSTKRILYNNTAIHTLEPGDYVEVSFAHGDRLVINGRQPALHITNIYTGKGVVISRPYINSQSTQLPTAILPGCNGDQDGDEVWSKEVRGILAKYEQLFLMLASCNMISPGHGGINYGIIQDELLSLNSLLGMNNISYYQAVLLLGNYMQYLVAHSDKKTFTGREIISAVIPRALNKQGVVVNGVMQHSRIKSADLGVGAGTIHSITKSLIDVNPLLGKNFLESILKIGKSFITMYPQGVRFRDLLSDSDVWTQINLQKDQRYREIECNRQRYINAVNSHQILPMDPDYESKFIKLEVAKVVSEVTTSVKKMVDGYLDNFRKGLDFNRLVLYILAEFKLDLATLSIIYAQANPSIEPKTSYLDRINPIYSAGDKSLGNLGLVNSSLMKGLKLQEMMLLSGKARENVVTTVCQTASKGEIGRYIIKNLENYHINYGLRFLVIGRYVANPCLNVYKMPVRQLFLVNLDLDLIRLCRDSSDILSKTIWNYWSQQSSWLFNPRSRRCETQLAYLADIQTTFDTHRSLEEMKSDEIVNRVETFFDYIHEQYMFRFSTVDMLKLITLVFARKCRVTYDGLEKLFDHIEMKYRLYPEDGAPIGVEAGTSISEVETQLTLSAHLQFTKNGCDVKVGESNTNISLMKINVSNLKNSGAKIFGLRSANKSQLLKIKYGLEFVSLEDIMLDIIYQPLDRNVQSVRITLSRSAMKRLQIETHTLDMMIENYISNTSYITHSLVDWEIIEDQLILDMELHLTHTKYRPILILSLKQNLSKGVFSLYRYLIEKVSIMNEMLISEDQYIMTCEIVNPIYLSYYDTTEIIITPSIEMCNKIGPIHAYNSLSSRYVSSGLMRFHTTLLAQHQSRHGVIRRVEKNAEDEMSTVSKIAFIKPMKDFQEAVKHKKIDPTDDVATCVLLNKPMKQGTGVVRVSTDIGMYLNSSNDQSRVTSLIL